MAEPTTYTQDDVIAFLRAALTDAGAPPKIIETHVSVVFLAGRKAYKMKKAVKFPFLDFTTLDARLEACEREITINRRTAPSIYKRVTPVTLEEHDFAIDGRGEPVEYLVEMDRFDEATVFDQLVREPGRLGRTVVEALADEIARFHAGAEVKTKREWYSGVRTIAENNRQSFDALPGETFDTGVAEHVTASTLERIDELKNVLSARQEHQHIRACHGDLHLRNICLVDGQPTMFDAIEFSDAFSDIDTMYDLAFLLMDLDFRGQRRLASFVLNRYLDVLTDDIDVFQLLPIYLSMRAQIRAHVGAAAARSQSDVSAAEREMNRAQEYLALSSTYLTQQSVKLAAVGGLSGSGKSRLAREIASEFAGGVGARVLRSDVERKRLAGVHPNQALGANGYTPEMTHKTFDHLFEAARQTLAAGQSVILDAVFASTAHRASAEQVAKELGVEFLGLWVDAPEDIRLSRVGQRQNNVSDITPEIARQQSGYDLGNLSWVPIDSAGDKARTVGSAVTVLQNTFQDFKKCC